MGTPPTEHSNGRTLARPPREPHAAARAREFLERKVCEPITLDDVAEAARVSRSHVIRLFRRHFGMTPFEYRRRLRLQRAEELLRSGLRSVEVAYEVGFADQSHMRSAMRASRRPGDPHAR